MAIFRLICQVEEVIIREAPIEIQAIDLDDALDKARGGDFPSEGWETISSDLQGWTYLASDSGQ